MLSYDDIEVYDLMRYSTAVFLVVNSVHRLANPATGMLYMSEKFFWFLPLSHTSIVYLVMAFSLFCATLILADRKTWQVSGMISLGIGFVVVMLFVQTPYLTGEPTNMIFFDIAMRDFGLVALFSSLSLMARKRD